MTRYLFFTLVLAVSASADLPATNHPTFNIPLMEDVVIDGKADDWADRGFQVNLLSPQSLSWLLPLGHNLPDTRDHEPRFRLGWNEEGLLVLITVRDNVSIEQEDIGMLWKYDGVELFLAARPGAKDFCQWAFSPGMAADHKELKWHFHENRKNEALKQKPATILAARQAAAGGHGYTLEAQLPWSALGIEPATGLVVGFQLKINESDDPAEPTRPVPWFPHPHTYADSSRMHKVRLALKPTPAQSLIAWLREHWSSQRRYIIVTAHDNMVGREATVERGGETVASGNFKRSKRGYARAHVEVNETPLAGPPQAYTVHVDGHASVTARLERSRDLSGWPDKPIPDPPEEKVPECFWNTGQNDPPREPQLVSSRGCNKATSGTGNKIITHQGKTHVAWLDSTEKGYFDRIRTLDHETGEWSPSYTLGTANGDHGRPAVTLDSKGYLHAVYGVHHNEIPYRRSLRPNDASEWTEEILFGKQLTYPTLVCGPDDTLYLTGRFGWDGVRMYTKAPSEDWEDRDLIMTGDEGRVNYAAFHSGLAWGPDHKVLHFSTSTYQTKDTDRWGMIQSANYMRSADFGKTWQKADGSPIQGTPTSETMDVLARDVSYSPTPGIMNIGAIVVDSRGKPFVLYNHYNMRPYGQVFLVTHDDQGKWQHLPLQSALETHAPGWVAIGFRGGLTITEDDVIHIALTIVPWDHPAALMEQARWRYPSMPGYSTNAVSARFGLKSAYQWLMENPKKSLIAWFESRDGGKTFTKRSVLNHNPYVIVQEPCFEIQTGFNHTPAGASPGILYFTGMSIGAPQDESVIDNDVYFIGSGQDTIRTVE